MITLSPTLKEMLREISHNSRIALALLSPYHTTNKDIDYLSYGNKMLTFLPKGKAFVEDSTNDWSDTNRQAGKPARIARRVIHPVYQEIFSDADYEQFANSLKALDITENVVFQLVDKESIKAAYNGRNYDRRTGSLQTSCMRYEWCQPFFDVYTDNAKLLVLTRKDNGLVVGRALVWENNDTETILDRIYGPDWVIEAFRQYARINNWLYRKYNTFEYPTMFVSPDGTQVKRQLRLKLPKYYKYMPYMDTLKYYDIVENVLTNTKPKKKGVFVLSGTHGNDHRLEYGMQYESYETAIERYLPTAPRKASREYLYGVATDTQETASAPVQWDTTTAWTQNVRDYYISEIAGTTWETTAVDWVDADPLDAE